MPIPQTHVLVINTGGTLTMQPSDKGALKASNDISLNEFLNGLSHDLNCQISLKNLHDSHGHELQLADSSAMGPIQWQALAQMIKNSAHFHSIIILHGTDTMAYTAAALAFSLAGHKQPVILTGAQVPLSQPGSDGPQNLRLAIYVACEQSNSLPMLSEVCICFAGQLLRGVRARKSNIRSAVGFTSPNYPVLAELFPSTHFYPSNLLQPKPLTRPTQARFNDKVINLSLTPGLTSETLLNILTMSDVSGLVLRVFGSGTAPQQLHLADVVKQARLQTDLRFVGAIVVTDVYSGGLQLSRYSAGQSLQAPYIIDGKDMTPETATVKLMWALGNQLQGQSFVALLQDNICGEITI